MTGKGRILSEAAFLFAPFGEIQGNSGFRVFRMFLETWFPRGKGIEIVLNMFFGNQFHLVKSLVKYRES